jgi:hypothetical protein
LSGGNITLPRLSECFKNAEEYLLNHWRYGYFILFYFMIGNYLL